MGKKNVEEMQKQRVVFLKGAAERGVNEKTAAEIFDLMEKFAGYGFNKSHAAAYSFVAWQTAYMKAHHTAAFFAGNLCLVMDQGEKTHALVDDAREMGIRILVPDINESEWYYTVPDEQSVRFGLGAIKGVGQQIVEDILDERRMNGPFIDIFDLAARVPSVNKKTLEQLTRAGAFDSLDANRGKLFANAEQAVIAAQAVADNAGQGSLFSDAFGEPERIVSWLAAEKWDEKKRFSEEREVFGFCFTGDAFASYRQEVKAIATPYSALQIGRNSVTIAGLVTNVRVIAGKRGKMAVVTLSDGVDTQEAVVYSAVYERYRTLLVPDDVLVLTGKVQEDRRTGGLSFIVDVIKTLEEVRLASHATAVVRITDTTVLEDLYKGILQAFSDDVGVPVHLEINAHNRKGTVLLKGLIHPTDHFIQLARTVPGVQSAYYAYPHRATQDFEETTLFADAVDSF